VKKILIIDDDDNFRTSLKDGLSMGDFITLVASNGKEGLNRIEVEHPDLVILDIKMPGMDGIEMLRKLRLRHRKLPVIMLTSYSEMRNDPEVILGNVSAFMDKPVDIRRLILIIEDILRKVE
jgi:DNA-binding response OmpR family regulator